MDQLQSMLQESFQTGLHRIENARDVYLWLRKNENSSLKESREYTEKFDIFKEIPAATDLLLKCFIVENTIPCYVRVERDGEKTYDEIEGKRIFQDTRINTYCLCGSILYYNSCHEEAPFLSDVDFGTLTGAIKEIRNNNEHAGKRGSVLNMQVQRIFTNLNKILARLTCNRENAQVLIEENVPLFDFSKFEVCMSNWNEEERKYIFITNSLHDIKKEELTVLLQLPWALILDLDCSSAYGGTQSVMTEAKIDYNRHFKSEFDVNHSITNTGNRVLYVPFYDEDDIRKQFPYKKTKLKRGERDEAQIEYMVEAVKNERSYATILVAGIHDNLMEEILKTIAKSFKKTEVIYLNKQVEVVKVDEEYEEETEVISFVENGDTSLYEAIHRIYVNREKLPGKKAETEKQEKYVYKVHVSGQRDLALYDEQLIKRIEQNFEFVHADAGCRDEEVNTVKFFHGDILNWATIKYDNIPVLLEKMKQFLGTIRKGGTNRCYELLHAPGIGGTTLGKQIAWELHKEMPVLEMKSYSGEQNFKNMLKTLYNNLFQKQAFFLLIDEDHISIKEMQEISQIIRASEERVLALFIKRINKIDAAMQYRRSDGQQTLLFTSLEPEKIKELEARCRSLLQITGQEYKFESRKKELDKYICQREKYALIINLYLLEENFNLREYISRFLRQIQPDEEGKRLKEMLVFTAMCSYYCGNVKIPVLYYTEYIFKKENIRGLKEMVKDFEEGFLLRTTEDDLTWYGIKHFLLAEEILKQILAPENSQDEEWKKCLPEYSCKFIDLLAERSRNSIQISRIVQNILMSLFTDKTKDRVERTTEGNFTALLDDLNEPAKINIILYLANCFEIIITKSIPMGKQKTEYKMLAHIYAQCARIRSRCRKLDEEEINENDVDKWMGKTEQIIYDESIHEYDLEDMLGRCLLDRVRRLREKDADPDVILENIDRALSHFDRTIWYGSAGYGIPGKLETLRHGIETIKIRDQYGESNMMEKLLMDPKGKGYFEQGNELIREMDEYELTSQGKIKILTEKENFEKTCCMQKPSEYLQSLENIRGNLSSDDYESQYLVRSAMVNGYERKYYEKSGDYRRSQLIHEALKGNLDAQRDAEKVFEHLDGLIRLSKNHKLSYSTYKCWFEYAKYKDVSLSTAKNVALLWKEEELRRANENTLYEENILKPYYYLYVITLLQYLKGSGPSKEDVWTRKNDLRNQIHSNSRRTVAIQDWFAYGKGLGQLYDKNWINFSDVDREERICLVEGEVVYYENGYGYLRIKNPKMLGNWGRTPSGQTFNKDSDVFFDVRQSGILTETDVGNGVRKKFKAGFSYENLRASTNSLEDRNVIKSVFIDPEDSKEQEKMELITETEEESFEKVALQMVEPSYIKFIPKYFIQDPNNENHAFLNGVLEDDTKAGLGYYDIERFGSELQEYSSVAEVLSRLKLASYIEVKILERNEEKGSAKVSVYETGISLKELMESISVENYIVDFYPDTVYPEFVSFADRYTLSYLNGSLPGGGRGGLSSTDIERYGRVCDEFGGSREVLERLNEQNSFKVVVMDNSNPARCVLSLFETGVPLQELLSEKEEVFVEETESEEAGAEEAPVERKEALPELPEHVILEECDFSKKNSISGIIRYEGKEYKGVIFQVNGPNMKKYEKQYKKHSRLRVQVKGKADNQYILKI